jgi:hypothetical protein
MRFRHAAIILLAVLGILGGGQFRIAKVFIKEPGRERTVFRVFAPGRDRDVITSTVFNLTDDDFMCHLYDWYGFRELDGGFGVATR